jgi:predicted GIY-YIG superfamily endonuclease
MKEKLNNRYIYLIQAQDSGLYKIGISIHPEKRVSEHQTGNGGKLKLIHKQIFEHTTQIEKTLHRLYQHLKREGEWFELSLNEEQAFLSICNKIEDNLNHLIASGNVFI